MQTAFHIGPGRDKDSIENITNALVRIMEAKADQKTIQAAIKAFTQMAEVKNVTVNGCTVYGDETHEHHHYPEPEQTETED